MTSVEMYCLKESRFLTRRQIPASDVNAIPSQDCEQLSDEEDAETETVTMIRSR